MKLFNIGDLNGTWPCPQCGGGIVGTSVCGCSLTYFSSKKYIIFYFAGSIKITLLENNRRKIWGSEESIYSVHKIDDKGNFGLEKNCKLSWEEIKEEINNMRKISGGFFPQPNPENIFTLNSEAIDIN